MRTAANGRNRRISAVSPQSSGRVALGQPEKSCRHYSTAGLPSTAEMLTEAQRRRSVPEPDLTSPPTWPNSGGERSEARPNSRCRLICTLTIEKIAADTAIMLDRLGREAATGGRSGQCAIAAARLCRRFEACGSQSEVDIYPGVDHGFAFACRATYHQAAVCHWARLLDLFNRALAPH